MSKLDDKNADLEEMNYPETVEELIKWDTFRGGDTFGTFTVITGFEGTGRCFWCGKDIEGRRRFCKQGSGCWTRYQEHFTWGYAKYECIKRYEYRCANCGVEEIGGTNGFTNLRVHHIIPLNGANRAVSVYNIFWNLICLCHECHKEIHQALGPHKQDSKPPCSWEEAIKVGQGILSLGNIQ